MAQKPNCQPEKEMVDECILGRSTAKHPLKWVDVTKCRSKEGTVVEKGPRKKTARKEAGDILGTKYWAVSFWAQWFDVKNLSCAVAQKKN